MEGLAYPLYYLSKQAGLYDTRLSVIIVFTVIQPAFGTQLLAAVLGQFPREIIETVSVARGVFQGRCLMDAAITDAAARLGIPRALDVFRCPARAYTCRSPCQVTDVSVPRPPCATPL